MTRRLFRHTAERRLESNQRGSKRGKQASPQHLLTDSLERVHSEMVTDGHSRLSPSRGQRGEGIAGGKTPRQAELRLHGRLSH